MVECLRQDESKSTSKSPIDEPSPSFAQQIFVSPPRQQVHLDPDQRTATSSSPVPSRERQESPVDGAPRGKCTTTNQSPDVSSELTPEEPEDDVGDALNNNIDLSDFEGFDHGDLDFMPDPFLFPMSMDDLLQEEEFLDLELLPRLPTTTPDYDAWALRLASRPMSAESIAPESTECGISGPFTYLYEQPYFPQTSPEMLSLRFDRLTCGILSVRLSATLQ